MKSRLTVAVITRNEEAEIRDFLDNALMVGDDVVVLDDGSSDRGVEIAPRVRAPRDRARRDACYRGELGDGLSSL